MTRALSFLAAALVFLAPPLLGKDEVGRLLTPEEAGFSPYLRWTPEGADGRVDWLLVTTEGLAPSFAPLVAHRRETGLAAELVTVEEIRRDALLGGGDLPERIRNFVRYVHAAYGLRFLVLAGDSDLVPPRMVPLGIRGEQVHYGELFAADGYFGGLEGEWNADADRRFGESEPDDDDRPDLSPEVFVGRIPAESPREAETFVAKLLLYERPVHLDYQHRIVYLGGKVFIENDADTHYRRLFASLFEPRGFSARFLTVAGEGAGHGDVMKALSEGAAIVSHYHHSFTYNLSLPTGAIDTGNYQGVANRERPTIFFSNGCYANQFTKEGISEKLLLSEEGGAAAFIGSTNTCFSTALGMEERFWRLLLEEGVETIGEALARMKAGVTSPIGPLGFLRLSMNLLGDPATRPWLGRPVRVDFTVTADDGGGLRVEVAGETNGRVFAAAVQDGPFGARRGPVPVGEKGAVLAAAVGNGNPIRVTVFGDFTVPVTKEVPDPVKVRVLSVRAAEGVVRVELAGAGQGDLEVPLPESPEPGVFRIEREIAGARLDLGIPVLAGADRALPLPGGAVRVPGFARMAPPRERGIPVIVEGEPVPPESVKEGPPPSGVEVEPTDSAIRVSWDGAWGARWIVQEQTGQGRRLLTPVPLVNPVFEMAGLAPLLTVDLVLSRLGGEETTEVAATTSFPFQAGFPQRIGANITSVQALDLDGKRGLEIVFGDDRLGLWALHADGREVRHAGDNWTFGLFAAIESGVFEPVVADILGSKRPEILATSKLNDRKLYAFTSEGEPLPGFPVSFGSRLMTPPLVGDFDGRKGVEILVVSGFGKTIELVRPDGTREPFAEIGQYNYGYPIAVDLDRDRALEVVVVDGAGKVWALDQGGKPMKGFPVDLGSPGRATPMVADLDGKRGLEIIAVGNGTTRLAVIDPRKGEVIAKLDIPGAGPPSNDSFFYPGLADLGGDGKLSIMVGTPSKKLFAIDLSKEGKLVVRPGFPIDLPAEARGVVAADVDGDGRDELFLSLHNGEVWGLGPDGGMLAGFPLRTKADTYAVPLLHDLDGDGDLELFLGAADGVLRVWDLPYRMARRVPTWCGLLNGEAMPGVPGKVRR